MRSVRSAVDFARSSSRECLRRCQKRGIFLAVGNGDGQVCGAEGEQKTDEEILEYRLFREFCEPAMENGNTSCSDSPSGNHGDAVHLRRNRSISCSGSLQKMHHQRLQTEATTADAEAAADGNYAPSVKSRSRKLTSSIVRLSRQPRLCEVVLLDGSEVAFSV
uniref:Uncharacterized protein n=1 Tax=Macrostomum lignano TaxID=282301 RepID=A0A1I8HNH1_9PLAT